MTTGGQFNSQRQARNELAETLSIMGIASQSKTSILNQIKKSGVQTATDHGLIEDGQAGPVIITSEDEKAAVEMGLVLSCNGSKRFDKGQIRDRIVDGGKGTPYIVKNLDEYMETLSSLITSIRCRKLPRQSYIIGAPNGFGKSHFANEAIITMFKAGWRTVPYVSLTELAETCVVNESNLLSALSGADYNDAAGELDLRYYGDPNARVTKVPQIVISRYSWSEYMNAECLMCYFTSFESKNVETRILHRIMKERSNKGLPTIVFMSTSLNPYLKEPRLREYIWDEILYNPKASGETVSRLKHISTYKKRTTNFGSGVAKAAGEINLMDGQ